MEIIEDTGNKLNIEKCRIAKQALSIRIDLSD